ncbi:MAG: hypothetical protein J0I84_21815 [Terrimonas sp.]|nr:hypothetical protein [Terrimonas sp.]OJY92906.1 MAG: hypothetical protein BGP13_21165 [Sphingobacteriales bacterium 40-81]
MKKIFILFGFITFATLLTQAQVTEPEKGERIKSLEIAYLTRQLQLTPEEAEKFWPVFNQYRKELRTAVVKSSGEDQLDREQKILDIRKKYKKNFAAVLSNERAQKFYDAEDRFKMLVKKEMNNRLKERGAGRQRR